MTVYIKNMVCNRCVKTVTAILCELGIEHNKVLLGEVALTKELAVKEREQLLQRLHEEGFELIDNKKARIVEQVKKIILEHVMVEADEKTQNLSDLIADKLHLEYSYLSHLFSSIEGITIEKYHIAQKIEKAKELLVYDELSLSEIAYQLGYSSVQHLSNQFKKVTGLTPSHFKQVGAEKRNPLDSVH